MNTLILQSSVYPDAVPGAADALYFSAGKTSYWNTTRKMWCIPAGDNISFDSFFNAFSLYKWRKHTELENLSFLAEVEGHGMVTLYLSQGLETRIIAQKEANSGVCTFNINMNDLPNGRLYFHWQAISDSHIIRFTFSTQCGNTDERRLAIIIPTFNRPEEIQSAAQRINNDLLSNPSFQSRVVLYVVNNGDEITVPDSENIVCIKNKNLGGAGGFTRGLIEVKRRGTEEFCLLMDDDASCEVESIRRAFAFLKLANTNEKMIAGAMLYAEKPGVVYEAGALYPYRQLQMYPLKSDLDVTLPDGLSEFDEDAQTPNYAAWWFCAFSVSVVRHYAFPFFVRGDDILFSIINRPDIVTLNGVCSWQKNFKSKYSAWVEYLSTRALLLPAFLYPTLVKRLTIPLFVLIKVILLCFSYRYSCAEAVLEAYKHVLKGPTNWSEDPDATKAKLLMSKIIAEEKKFICHQVINRGFAVKLKVETLLHKVLRLLLLNGYLIPSVFLPQSKTIINSTEIHPTRYAFLKRDVIYFNEEKNSYCLHSRSARRAVILVLKTILCISWGIVTFGYIAKNYKKEINHLTSELYWKKYF
ncbi:GT2 family glycosyltransferase [Rahnella sp. BIGb0236]|uniref:glycosyltransferase n=1 Tax=Rahnella sp. BIGb0236 TaxID=2485117 RepID=UPI00106139A5|nr:glycosyltransferase [Rahnella sp. BIGb0236]TDS84881.1 GT2 family glycosyltransferase [Rahnella sp. BIGb0236]